jgi:hypothetical protein
MGKDAMKTLLGLAAVAALAAGGAFAQSSGEEMTGAKAWDTDQDMSVSREEFDIGMESAFGDMDADADGMISAEEATAGGVSGEDLETYDADGDGMLSRDEYGEGVFAAHDANQDAMWDESEFTSFDESRRGAESESN